MFIEYSAISALSVIVYLFSILFPSRAPAIYAISHNVNSERMFAKVKSFEILF